MNAPAMDETLKTPWHGESYDRFLNETLPRLLAERLPLAGYHAERSGPRTARVRVTLAGADGEIPLAFEDLPACDDAGRFESAGRPVVVVPVASGERLDEAVVLCVGEQLTAWVSERLGEAPADLHFDEPLARNWLPLKQWLDEALTPGGAPWGEPVAAQFQDVRNPLARLTHLRRILIPTAGEIIAHGQLGRVCPVETPEGPFLGRVGTVVRGAEVRDGKLRIVDDAPAARLGPAAAMIPLLRHDDPNRALMGANMMRQWIELEPREPARVRSGCEPADPNFWCGRNLWTAFVCWGPDTYEDGIAVSESGAAKLGGDRPLEPGDKLSNRHGAKGVVSRVLPDEAMPHLPDGRPVELVYSFIGLHTRLNFGQVMEAVLGRIAEARGASVVAGPFDGPARDDLPRMLADAGLPETGMETLTDGRDGPPLERPSLVGVVYWGTTCHLAADKLQGGAANEPPEVMDGLDYIALRDAGAAENILDGYNTRSRAHPEAGSLARRVASGPVEPAGAPSAMLRALQRRLAIGGIAAKLSGGALSFAFADPPGETLELAAPVPHPWLPEREIGRIGACDGVPAYRDVVAANTRLARMTGNGAPGGMVEKARAELARRVEVVLAAVLSGASRRPLPPRPALDRDLLPGRPSPAEPGPLDFAAEVSFSGRAVIAPGGNLHHDQVGLPDELAWRLFAPHVAREMGGSAGLDARSERAAEVLDRVLSGSWVLVNRKPSLEPTSWLACRPVRVGGRALRLPLLACPVMNADFDGDQAAVFVPLSAAAQQEAGERLTLAAHVRRDPKTLDRIALWHEPLVGLALLARTEGGLREIAKLAGVEIATEDGLVTRRTVRAAMRSLCLRDGVDKALAALERLMRRGFEVARRSGASMSPFIGRDVIRPPAPATDDAWAWYACRECVADHIEARRDFDAPDMGPQLLAVQTGARGKTEHLVTLAGLAGAVSDLDDRLVPAGYCLADGAGPDEYFTRVIGARRGLGQVLSDMSAHARWLQQDRRPAGFGVLARAMRSTRPGMVFAQAAQRGEFDPLTDPDARLFVGLNPKKVSGTFFAPKKGS